MKLYRLLGLILTCLLFCKSYAQTQFLTSVRGTAIDVSLVGKKTNLSIPVELAKGYTVEQLDIFMVDVRSEKISGSVPISSFLPPTLVNIAQKAYIQLDINNEPVVSPGVYILELRIRPKSTADSVQKLALAVTVNAATLRSILPIVVTRRNTFFGMDYKSYGATIQVQEIGRKATLDPISIVRVRTVNSKNVLVPATITLKNSPQPVKDGVANLELNISGDLPRGKVTSTVEIYSPQMTESVPATLEITTRPGIHELLVTILAGLIIGYFVKTVLDSRVKIGSARVGALETLRTIAAELANRPDPIFTAKVNAIQIEVHRKMRSANDTEITNAVNTANDELKLAVSDYNSRRNLLQQELDLWEGLLDDVDWLRCELGPKSTYELSDFEIAKQENKNGNITRARDHFTKFTSGFSTSFSKQLNLHRRRLINELSTIKKSQMALPDTLTEVSKLLPKLDLINESGKTTVTAALLKAVRDVEGGLVDLLNQAGIELEKIAGDVVGTLNEVVGLNDRVAVEELDNEAAALVQVLMDQKADPCEVLENFASKLDGFYKTLISAIRNQTIIPVEKQGTHDLNNADREAIAVSIEAGHYWDAAKKVVTLVERNRIKTTMAAPDQLPDINQVEKLKFQPLRPATVSIKTHKTILDDKSGSLDIMIQETRKSVTRARMLQTLLSGVVIMIIGCALFAETFYGTYMDVASVFMWAFLLDVSVATIIAGLGAKVAKV